MIPRLLPEMAFLLSNALSHHVGHSAWKKSHSHNPQNFPWEDLNRCGQTQGEHWKIKKQFSRKCGSVHVCVFLRLRLVTYCIVKSYSAHVPTCVLLMVLFLTVFVSSPYSACSSLGSPKVSKHTFGNCWKWQLLYRISSNSSTSLIIQTCFLAEMELFLSF